MIQVQTVAIEYIHQVWDKVAPFLEESAKTGTNDCTVEQLRLLLVKGEQGLLVGVEDGIIVGAMTVELSNQPNQRTATITALGGRGVVDAETFSQVEDWARLAGATKIRAWAQDAQARLYRQKAGFTTVRHVVEKSL